MPLTFEIFEDEYYLMDPIYFNGKYAELHFEVDGLYITKWFYPYKVNNALSVSNNGDINNNNILEQFIKDIKNDKNCKYFRDNEVIFEFKDGVFLIDSITMSTGCNLILDMELLEIHNKKDDVITILSNLHDWLKSLY
jgi:hypothetical protein